MAVPSRDPQELSVGLCIARLLTCRGILNGVLSLAVGCPLSSALPPLFKLGSSLQHPLLLQKLGYNRYLQPSRLWMLERL